MPMPSQHAVLVGRIATGEVEDTPGRPQTACIRARPPHNKKVRIGPSSRNARSAPIAPGPPRWRVSGGSRLPRARAYETAPAGAD
jgi:hypothetical protein